MKTVGELLKGRRLKYKLSLEGISKSTKIQKKYLIAIENSTYKDLPAATFVKGFIQNYSKAIGADPSIMLAVFRRDFVQDYYGKIVPRSFTAPIEKKFNFSPKIISIASFGLIGAVVLGIFIRQIALFYQGPTIEVNQPQEGQLVTSPIQVDGESSSGSIVTINNQPTSMDDDRFFSTQIQLSPGLHSITIQAETRDGKKTTIQRNVEVSP